MPKRPDGRIERGQRLSTAISARAWNRAQDAADLVLGPRLQFAAEAALQQDQLSIVVPCLVSSVFNDIGYGHIVQITNARGRLPDIRPDKQGGPEKFVPEFQQLQGFIHTPVVFNSSVNTFRLQHATAFGVIVGGSTMPRPGKPQTVQVCIAGLCWARVRARGAVAGFVQPALQRLNTDTAANLAGCLESSDAGVARMLGFVFGPQNTPLVLNANSGTLQITWGLVCL